MTTERQEIKPPQQVRSDQTLRIAHTPTLRERHTDRETVPRDRDRDHSLRSWRSVLLENRLSGATQVPSSPGTIVTRKSRGFATTERSGGDGGDGEMVLDALIDEPVPGEMQVSAATEYATPGGSFIGFQSGSTRSGDTSSRVRPSVWLRIGYWLANLQAVTILGLVGVLLMVNTRITTPLKTFPLTDDQDAMLLSHAFGLRVSEILLFIATAFQFYLYVDATVTSNRSQLLASGFFLIISIVYAVTHTFQQRSFLWQITEFMPDYNFGGGRDRAASALSYTLVAADVTFGVIWAFLGPGVWAGMRWKLYKDEGADTITRLRTFRHHVFQLVLKLALFFHISVTIQLYFLVLGGLGWSIFANFILAFDGMMLALGFYTISVIGGGAVAERSPSTMSLFVIGCMAEIVFLLEFCISVLRNKVAGSYPLDAAGSVYTLALSALLTVLTLLVAGIIAAMNAREYMSIWDLPRRQRSRSGHERLTSQITVVEPPAIEVTRAQTASTLTDDIQSDRPEDREDSLARYGTSAGTRNRPGSMPARMGGGLRVEREELADDREDSLARYGTSPARMWGIVHNEREVELVDDREDSLARYGTGLGTWTRARPRSTSRPPVAPGAEI